MGDETTGGSKLDALSKDELVKLVKKYVVLHKQLKSKNEELTNKLNSVETKDNTQTDVHDETIRKLNEQIDSLKSDNSKLNEHIKILDSEMASLRAHADELERFRVDMEPQLETARREIELNKSMLDMLNNEIGHLNSEKLQLEKKLISARRNTTPSVIVEEEEEDLIEEERLGAGGNKSSSNRGVHRRAEDSRGSPSAGDQIDVASEEHDSHIAGTSGQPITTSDGSLLFLNKDLEEMTFYVDELKSELEAERERNNEFVNEITTLRQELEQLKQTTQRTDKTETTTTTTTTTETRKDDTKRLRELFAMLLDSNENGHVVGESEEAMVESVRAKLNEMRSKETYMESQMEKIIADYKREMSQLEVKITERDAQVDTLKSQNEAKLKALKSELDSERDKSKSIQLKLERIEKEAAKSKFLDLEIADYERSIKSLNVQIISKDKELSDTRAELAGLTASVEKSRADIERLENELNEEREKSQKLKQTLVLTKKELAEAKTHAAEHQSNDASTRHQIERLQFDLDAFKVQLVESGAEKERLRERINVLVEASQRAEELAEKKIEDKQEEIDELKSRLKSLETEYDAYKHKVQHAFKKQKEESIQSRESSRQVATAEQEAELERLRASVRALTAQLDESNERVASVERANESLQDEYTRCLERNTRLLADLKHKDTHWEAKCNELTRQGAAQQEESNKAMRSLEELSEQRQVELRERVKSLQAQHCQAINLLQSQLIESRGEVERLTRQVDEMVAAAAKSKSPDANNGGVEQRTLSPNSSGVFNRTSSSPRFDPIASRGLVVTIQDDSTETQENENQTASSHSNGLLSSKTIKTFEQLLNEANTTSSSTSSSSNSPNRDFSGLSQVIDKLKGDLSKSRVQVEHLNELLNESELNNNRLSDQINVLKEEIRRLERNQEREKSISNMEYLKNVVMKFLTLSTVQERTQLIPVLATMLRLSQDEQNAIANYSKMISSNQSSSWGDYLPKWSS